MADKKYIKAIYETMLRILKEKDVVIRNAGVYDTTLYEVYFEGKKIFSVYADLECVYIQGNRIDVGNYAQKLHNEIEKILNKRKRAASLSKSSLDKDVEWMINATGLER